MSTLAAAWAQTHATLRDALLTHLESALRADHRFVAAWLFGSLGRGGDAD